LNIIATRGVAPVVSQAYARLARLPPQKEPINLGELLKQVASLELESRSASFKVRTSWSKATPRNWNNS
jgi:hypothetical protein